MDTRVLSLFAGCFLLVTPASSLARGTGECLGEIRFPVETSAATGTPGTAIEACYQALAHECAPGELADESVSAQVTYYNPDIAYALAWCKGICVYTYGVPCEETAGIPGLAPQ